MSPDSPKEKLPIRKDSAKIVADCSEAQALGLLDQPNVQRIHEAVDRDKKSETAPK